MVPDLVGKNYTGGSGAQLHSHPWPGHPAGQNSFLDDAVEAAEEVRAPGVLEADEAVDDREARGVGDPDGAGADEVGGGVNLEAGQVAGEGAVGVAEVELEA